MRKRILVTGGAGFLGSHLCERLLDEEHELICLDNFFTGQRRNVRHLTRSDRFEVIRDDVSVPMLLEVDEIYHLACPASPIHYQRNPVRTIGTAVQGTLNVLNLARDTGAKILIASTSEVYGDPVEHPQTESYWGNVNPIGPRACYDEGKRCAEALTVSFARQYGLEARIVRIFNTYGPRMHLDDGRVVSNFIIQALRGAPITIYGEGGQTRSFCYCKDLIDGLIRLMNTKSDPGPVNMGNPREFTILELAEKVIKLTSATSKLEHHELPTDDPVRRRPDITKAREFLGWAPTIDLDEGLQYTIDYFRELLAESARA